VARACSALERHLGKAAQLAAVQAARTLLAQQLDGPHADAQVLVDPLAVEVVGHAGQLDLAVQRLVADAQQRAVGHAEAEAVGGNGGAFHVQRHRAALAEAALGARWCAAAVPSCGCRCWPRCRCAGSSSARSPSCVTSATACSSATCTSASAGIGTHSGRSSSSTWSSRT
jgi:hypothetical protein